MQNNVPVRLVFNVDKAYISDEHLFVKPDFIKSNDLKVILSEYKLVAAYKNRYMTNGKIDPFIREKTKNEKDTWFIIDEINQSEANELLDRLKKTGKLITGNIENSFLLFPSAEKISYDAKFTAEQWHLTRATGINAEDVWNINKGRNDVVIAVCDGGVDYTHRNLDPGNRSRVITGYDTANKDNNPMDDLPDKNSDSYANHGTHIAGIIGAIPTPENDISGVMQNCKIMPLKMVGSGGIKLPFTTNYQWDFSTTAFPSDVADAIDYAVNNGAHVINLSYGFASPDLASLENIVLKIPLLSNTIRSAYINNVVIIAAMGNDGINSPNRYYPAMFYPVIAVGNTTVSGVRANSSSIGSHISVSAPGTSIYSTLRDNKLGYKSGTSMAAPIVSGIAGLIISQSKDRGLNLTNDDVRQILERTAHDVKDSGIGFDNETGYGIVNAFDALSLIAEPNNVLRATQIGGGSEEKKETDMKLIINGDYWGTTGLTSGTYFADQYEVKQYIRFPKKFLSPPSHIWIRERESGTMSFTNPNNGKPFLEISNITEDGFNVRYAIYHIKYNMLGQAIDRWVPYKVSSVKIAYTAIGILPTMTEPQSYTLCYGETLKMSINNLPIGAAVKWSTTTSLSYGPYLELTSGQGTPNAIFKATGGSGDVIIRATVTYNGKSFDLQTCKIWTGTPLARVASYDLPQKVSDYYDSMITLPSSFLYGLSTTFYMDVLGGTGNFSDYEWHNNNTSNYTITSPDGREVAESGIPLRGNAAIIKVKYIPNTPSFGIRAKNKCGSTVQKQISGGIVAGNIISKSVIENNNQEQIIKEESFSSIRIYNLSSGLLVHTEKNVTDFNIENTKLRAGIYIVEKTHEDGSVTREKVMKKY